MKLTIERGLLLKVLTHIQSVVERRNTIPILSNVSKKGLKAPPQVYRALEKLIEVGEVHKIESLNSFVACNSKCIEPNGTIFSICKSCDQTTEVSNADLAKFLSDFKDMNGTQFSGFNLELFGTCKSCKA